MAKYGARRPIFAPIKTEPEGKLPTYDAYSIIGRLIKADVTPTFASGKLYADNELAESVDEFVNATCAMETDDITDGVSQKIYGAKVVDGEVHYKTGDTPPRGGLAHYVTIMRKGGKSYKGFYYPVVQATIGTDNAQTKGDNITFGTSNPSFTIFPSNTTAWRITKEFKTEAEAITWCNQKLGGTAKPPADPPSDPPTGGGS